MSHSSSFDDDLFFIFISSSSFFMVAPRATVACGARLVRGARVASGYTTTFSFFVVFLR
jgi:hypothetical protein